MTTVAVLADPPRPGAVLPALVDDGPLDDEEAADLYTATLRDVCLAVESSGADLLVNYRVPADLSEDEDEAEAAVRTALDPALDTGSTRFEVQVGSSRSARVGNTVTHLLEEEGVRSVAALDPTAALVERRHVDSAAMKLRQSEVVLGPAPGGRAWYAAFTVPVDFTDVYDPPALATLTDRGRSEDNDVDFMQRLPVVETPADLAGTLVELRARKRAEKHVPAHTTARLEAFDLAVVPTDDGVDVTRS
jgi:hypothetical protein